MGLGFRVRGPKDLYRGLYRQGLYRTALRGSHLAVQDLHSFGARAYGFPTVHLKSDNKAFPGLTASLVYIQAS